MLYPNLREKRAHLSTLALLASGFALLATNALASPASETARLHEWLNEQYEEELRFSPTELTNLGRRDLYDQIDDYSLDATDREIAWYRQSVEELKANFVYDELDAEGQASYDFWEYRLGRLEESREFSLQNYPMSQLSGPHTSLPRTMLNYHDVESLADMEAYNERIRQIGRAIDQTLERVQQAAKKGVRPPRFAQETLITQLKAVTTGQPFSEGDDTALWADAKNKVAALREAGTIDDATATRLLDENKAALLEKLGPAYARAIDWFSSDVNNNLMRPPKRLTCPEARITTPIASAISRPQT